jgi:hypothetical protein
MTLEMEYPYSDILKGIQEPTKYSLLFFSRSNIRNVQNAIINGVFKATGRVIPPQKDEQVVNVMKGIYLQNSRVPYSESEYKENIQLLNDMVVEFAVKDVSNTVRQQVEYLRFIKLENRELPDRPVSDNTFGTKTYNDRLSME